jgi:hypothetical protein
MRKHLESVERNLLRPADAERQPEPSMASA